jgi:hypothetical protein
VKDAAEFDENGIATHIPERKAAMLPKILAAAALVTLGFIIYSQRKNTKGLQKKVVSKLGKTLMVSSLGALGAAAPVSAAVPNIPMVPSI